MATPAADRATAAVPSPSAVRILNRELSELSLSERVLELAGDSKEPLLERVNFSAIVAGNLDQFFMIRVAGLLEQVAGDIDVRSADGCSPAQTLAAIRDRILGVTRVQSKLWAGELFPALAAKGIEIGSVESLSRLQLAALGRRFEHEIFPVLTPLAVSSGQPFPFISPLSLSLGVLVRDPETKERRFARVKVPESLPRFMRGAPGGALLPLESVIAHFLPQLFPGMQIEERAFFRVTRDADFAVSDEANDLLEALQSELRRRRFGDVVRLEISDSMSDAMLAQLKQGLGIGDDEIYPVRGLLDLSELSQIAALDHPELKYQPWRGATRRPFNTPDPSCLFAALRAEDALVQLPYDSFSASVEAFVAAAAEDPQVSALKTTVYRTSDESALAPALIAAAESGKQAVCLVELKARFDEQRNIEWSQRLEHAGVHVVHGFPRVKIHAKTTLVVRRDPDGLRRYAHIGTGNYHAVTARLYEDLGLFTADEDITADVADLFNYLTGFGKPQAFRKLLVGPFNLRDRLVDEIRVTAAAAAAGLTAAIRLKVNALHDEQMIEELYRASQSGVKIEIVTRSICGLRPGVVGLSENVTVRSVLGRFLEHSRFFIFRRGEESSYFVGSADLLTRNLDHRIEVVTPIDAPTLRAELDTAFEALLADNALAWELRADATWRRLQPARGELPRTAQAQLMSRADLRNDSVA
ncbi:MAG: polyphosphate kinase 1 [Gaiellaceae bacterium]